MKKVISLMLSLVMLISVTAGLDFSVQAAYDYTGFNQKLDQIKAEYPEGTNWSNSNSYPSGWYGCWAFANLCADRIFGCSTPKNNWNAVSVSSVLPGDVIATSSHAMFVINIVGNTITVVEGNYGVNTHIVHWGRQFDKYSESFTVYHAPNYDSVISQDNSPIIALDSVTSSSAEKITVTGWAFDNDNVNIALSIHVYAYVDNNPVWVGATTANLERKDVNNAYSCGNYHGFYATFDAPVTGNITVKVAAINIGEGNNSWSDAKAVTVTAVEHNPKIVVDSVKPAGAGKITISGWAYDPDNTNKALSIHVYTYSGDTPIWVGATTANTKREDVNKVYGCGNYHGFEAVMYPSISGNIKIGIAAINIEKGSNIFANAKTVTVTADTEKPIISDVKVSNITSKGYTITAKVSDNAAVRKVAFPTWTVKNGQDDIDGNWTEKSIGTIKDGVVTYQVKATDHNNEIGDYVTHIYVYDYAGNVTSVGNSKYPELKVNVHDHKKIVDKAIAATCTSAGKTEGSHCSVCNEVFVEQKEVSALGHKWDSGKATKKATPTATGVKTYTCTVCKATKTAVIAKCAKYANPLTASGKTVTIKYKNLKKKNQTVAQKNAFTVNIAQGKVTYTKASGNKSITVSSAGKITVKKGLKKGTYKIAVKITAAGNATYKAATKTVKVTIKVK